MKEIVALTLVIVSLCTGHYHKTEEGIETNAQNIVISGEMTENSGEEITEEVIEVIEEPVLESITVNSTMPYYIKVNRTQNVVNIYAKEPDGTYLPFKAMICSIGKATPASGKVHKTTTYKTRWNPLSGKVYGQYITQIVGDILFHSVPYTAKDPSTLEYWEYDKLGTFASLGCVRLTVEDAKWIYDNIASGTSVEFYEDENPGPFGKPEAQKISDNEACRGWDPTDMAEENPWRNLPEM